MITDHSSGSEGRGDRKLRRACKAYVTVYHHIPLYLTRICPPYRAKTPQEVTIQGLHGHAKTYDLDIVQIPGKGRGVITKEAVHQGAFLLEYQTYKVYPRKERRRYDEEYAANEEGCMIFEVQTPKGWYCLDATHRFSTPGHLLNHSLGSSATVRPSKPIFLKRKWRVRFLTTRPLQSGEELTWDYKSPPNGQKWLMRRATKDKIG